MIVRLKVGFAMLLLGFTAWAPLAAATLGGSGRVVVLSLPVAWVAGLVGVQVVARHDANIAAIRELAPSAVLALPVGGLILGILGIVLLVLGLEL
jgi:hypothetical protein